MLKCSDVENNTHFWININRGVKMRCGFQITSVVLSGSKNVICVCYKKQ